MSTRKLPVVFLLVLGCTILLTEGSSHASDESPSVFVLPPLPYAYDALEPHIDAVTMEIHHQRHHAAYVNNLNKALLGQEAKPLEAIIEKVSKYPVAVRNNAGGHYNHDLFWKVMKPNGGGEPQGKLGHQIKTAFGSYEGFKEQMSAAGLAQFGSGWVWLIVQDGKLKITTTANQDNPLMDVVTERGFPLLGIDLWEHAYYLKYQNRRGDYLAAFWDVVNWGYVGERFASVSPVEIGGPYPLR